MPFSLLPAIDLTAGQLGVFTPDGPRPVASFGGDPLVAVASYVEAGARWVHVVDMDLAFDGEAANLRTVRQIASSQDVRIQASGGVSSWAQFHAFLEVGARRVVVSSTALADEKEVHEILARARPGEVVFGIEVAAGRIRSRGSREVDLELMATLERLQAAGAPSFLVTAIDRVGTRGGPDTALVRRVARAGLPTLAAGGIRSLADLIDLRAAGATGAVVGRAALDGSLPLAKAITWAAT